jgi:FAD-linked sulfhydryl oxidase
MLWLETNERSQPQEICCSGPEVAKILPTLSAHLISDAMSNATTSSTPTKRQMPPGMVMGPDGKPCKICTAFRNWQPGTTNYTEADSHRAARKTTTPKGTERQANIPTTAGAAGITTSFVAGSTASAVDTSQAANEQPTRPNEPPPNCPPDVEQLGRATWTFLHTTAAYYPEKPTPTQRANMLMLLRALPLLYPCKWCADDFGQDLVKHAPDVSGRVALSRWLCERHNEVNSKLGKEKFDCAKVDERWRDGPPDGSCD